MLTFILFFVVSLIASTAGAISGIGGGIIIKPVLESASDYSVQVISFLSGCTVLIMSVVSLLRGRKSAVEFEYRRGTLLAVGAVTGGILGKLLFDSFAGGFGGTFLAAAQSLILGLIVVGLLVYIKVKERFKGKNLQHAAQCLLLGLVLGMVSAFLGIGGGPMNLAVLSYFLSMDTKKASLHSLYIVLFSQASNLLMTAIRGMIPAVPVALLFCVVCGGVLGALIGSGLSRRMDNKAVDKLYGAVLIFVLLVSGGNLITYLS